MFVQATQCKHGKHAYLTYLVRESFRTPKAPRSRTLCNITALPQPTRELIAQSLRGQTFVATDQLALTDALSFGGLAGFPQAWAHLGLDHIFHRLTNLRAA